MNKIWWKKIHNYFGLSSAVFLLVLLVTGILLNHPSLFKDKTLKTIAADPSNPQKLFSGKKDGFYYSLDNGQSWQEVPMLYPPEEVSDIAISPANPKHLYVLEKWGKIFASYDGGQIWANIPLPFDPQSLGIELKKISIAPEEKIILLTSHGWLSTADGGKNWDAAQFHKDKKPLQRLILTLHNGYFFGPAFVWVYDFSAAALLILIISGFILWNIGRKGV